MRGDGGRIRLPGVPPLELHQGALFARAGTLTRTHEQHDVRLLILIAVITAGSMGGMAVTWDLSSWVTRRSPVNPAAAWARFQEGCKCPQGGSAEGQTVDAEPMEAVPRIVRIGGWLWRQAGGTAVGGDRILWRCQACRTPRRREHLEETGLLSLSGDVPLPPGTVIETDLLSVQATEPSRNDCVPYGAHRPSSQVGAADLDQTTGLPSISFELTRREPDLCRAHGGQRQQTPDRRAR